MSCKKSLSSANAAYAPASLEVHLPRDQARLPQIYCKFIDQAEQVWPALVSRRRQGLDRPVEKPYESDHQSLSA